MVAILPDFASCFVDDAADAAMVAVVVTAERKAVAMCC